MSTSIDVLVIGQGLAGSILAHQLARQGASVRVVDDGHRSSASLAAGGLVNPRAGRRLARHPRADAWLASASRCYGALQPYATRPLFTPKPMLRLFLSAEQRTRFEHDQALVAAAARTDYRPLDPATSPALQGVCAPHGAIEQLDTGLVDVPAVLAAAGRWLGTEGLLIRHAFDPQTLVPRGNALAARLPGGDLLAARVVFCAGARDRTNPWFGDLPWRINKGETLMLRGHGLAPGHLVNGRKWLAPIDGEHALTGSTHTREELSDAPTKAGSLEILSGARDQLTSTRADLEVLDHRTGLRPGTADRQPFIGSLPAQPALALFNGFAGRGCLAVPWYAEQFTAWCATGAPLPAEVGLARTGSLAASITR